MELMSNRKKILVLDKNGRMQSVVDEVMKYGEWETLTVYDSAAVYDRARAYRPDLIILDYTLIDEDCATVCQDFKNDPELQHIPLFIVTGYNTRRARNYYYSCDALFIKPLDMEVLASRMDYLLAS